MTAKLTASADGSKVLIGTAAENALEIDATAKTIKALSPYSLAIAEVVSNSNGTCVKFVDGTMIYYHRFAPTTPAGTIYNSPTIVFPVPFVGAAVGQMSFMSSFPWTVNGNFETKNMITEYAFSYINNHTSSLTIECFITVFGRWKT
jgi:hypothetical protein